jgi:hypothetical protein
VVKEELLESLRKDLLAYFQQLDSLLLIRSLTFEPIHSDRALFDFAAFKKKRLVGRYSGLAGYENGVFFVSGIRHTTN